MSELQQKVYFANTPANKPLLWSRIAMKESGVYRDYQDILDALLDPKLIYFNDALTNDQIDECNYIITQLKEHCFRAILILNWSSIDKQ
jgi:hypothetical protein